MIASKKQSKGPETETKELGTSELHDEGFKIIVEKGHTELQGKTDKIRYKN